MKSVSHSEQRTESRTHLYYYLRVFEPQTDRLIGHIVDLSSGGALLTTTEKVHTQDIIELDVESSVEVGLSQKVRISAQCRWQRCDEDQGLHDTGLQFNVLTSEAKALLTTAH